MTAVQLRNDPREWLKIRRDGVSLNRGVYRGKEASLKAGSSCSFSDVRLSAHHQPGKPGVVLFKPRIVIFTQQWRPRLHQPSPPSPQLVSVRWFLLAARPRQAEG